MKGWPGIGVLISVLWLVGVPIYLMVDTNNTAKVVYQSCIFFASTHWIRRTFASSENT